MTMIKTHYFILSLLVLFFAACGGDDECTPESVAGTYSFVSVECDPATEIDMSDPGSIENSDLITIKAIDETTISIEGEDGSALELMLSGCEFAGDPLSLEFFGLSITSSYGGKFDGNTLSLTIATSIEGEIDGQPDFENKNTSCTVIASK